MRCRVLAAAAGVPAYVVVPDRTLIELATHRLGPLGEQVGEGGADRAATEQSRVVTDDQYGDIRRGGRSVYTATTSTRQLTRKLEELKYDGFIGLEYKPATGKTEESFGWVPKAARGADIGSSELTIY